METMAWELSGNTILAEFATKAGMGGERAGWKKKNEGTERERGVGCIDGRPGSAKSSDDTIKRDVMEKKKKGTQKETISGR